MTDEEERALREQLARLLQEHRDLDAAIEALVISPGSDLIQVQRLKKRKLVLRDKIRRIEDQLTPRSVSIDPFTVAARLRVTTTAHGQGNTDGCAECWSHIERSTGACGGTFLSKQLHQQHAESGDPRDGCRQGHQIRVAELSLSRRWRLHRRSDKSLEELSKMFRW